jgi:Rhodopirellula transposase DDE domain
MKDQAWIKETFERLRLLMDERLCRLWAASEARALGFGGVTAVSAATGLSHNRIREGMKELQRLGENPQSAIPHENVGSGARGRNPVYRVRRPGAGRKLIEVKDPGIVAALERLLADEVAGDPMSEQRWIRSSLRRLSTKLTEEGHQAGTGAVRRLLKSMGFSLKANKRKQGRPGCPERDAQFKYIASQRQRFTAQGLPVMSVDTKKKELIGEFRSDGKTWRKKAEEVNEHDFPGVAECKAVPFGIYDVARNEGFVYVGMSNATPEFAVHSLANWWKEEGRRMYPKASELLILADGGGCNGCRARAWKVYLQERLCDTFGLTVTVCHYPTGCSKWNPVEHRLFSYISVNWAGKPLKTLGIMLGYIRGTTTATGLKVKAFLDERTYRKSPSLTRQDVEQLSVEAHELCPTWNYTLHRRRADN